MPRNETKTSLQPPQTIIEQNPIFPNNAAITVVNVWLIFIDVPHACPTHLAVQCKQLERLLWCPQFYEFKMLLNESQYALCCSKLFLFIIHEKMKTFTAGRGLMIWARRMVFLAGLTSCVLVVHLVLKGRHNLLVPFSFFLVEIMKIKNKNKKAFWIICAMVYTIPPQSVTCKLNRKCYGWWFYVSVRLQQKVRPSLGNSSLSNLW